jgi:hypothetical protein
VLFLGSSALARAIYWRQLDWAHIAADGLEVRIGTDDCTDHAMMLRDLLRPYLTGIPPQ